MRITIVTIGSRGDVQPYIALGLGLQAAGYRVRLATHRLYEPFVCHYGLEFAPVAGDPQDLVTTDAGRAWSESGGNILRFMRHFMRLLTPVVRQVGDDIAAACRDTDAILYSTLAFVSYYAGQKLGVPALAAPLQPLTRTRRFPNIAFPQQLSLPGSLNLLTHLLAEQIFWQPVRSLVNEWVTEALELPAVPLLGPFQELNRGRQPIIYGFSPTVVPPPPDWAPNMHVSGYWFLEQKEEWTPPPELVAFLEAGPAPVYIGFGSMSGRRPEETTALVRQALGLSGQRAVLLLGWGGLQPTAFDPGQVLLVEDVPHDWLFPRMAAVVHHGGAGTTAAGLRAGVPSVLIPFFSDQNFWAARVKALGAGPRPLPRRRLKAADLAAALLEATQNGEIRRRAATVGAQIRAEQGVQNAVHLVERYVDG